MFLFDIKRDGRGNNKIETRYIYIVEIYLYADSREVATVVSFS